MISKSEHYHAPLGHAFPGYAIVDAPRSLGIPNATHNNTRGSITRRLEEELIRAANGLTPGRRPGMRCCAADDPAVLNRVLNLETGSLAAEAALKLALCRFYRHEPGEAAAPLRRTASPVLLVLGDDDGDACGQLPRHDDLHAGDARLWPELRGPIRRTRACARRGRPPQFDRRSGGGLPKLRDAAPSRSRPSCTRSS